MKNESCELCHQEKTLLVSHIFPKFIIKWLKDSSITGHLRDPYQSNRRIQDGIKEKLLCEDCEKLFSKYETLFSRKIFHPFIKDHTDKAGRIIKDGFLPYSEWNLKFLLSVQWRVLSHQLENFVSDGDLPLKTEKILRSTLLNWRDYLLGKKDYTNSHTYLLFLRNLNDGTGDMPPGLSPKINHYLLRTIDGSIVFTESNCNFYTKLGPIAIISGLDSKEISGYPNSKIKKTGKIKIEQIWNNIKMNNYIFYDRPNEVYDISKKTEKQEEQVRKSLRKNWDKKDSTMSLAVTYSDYLMNQGID